ncbi:hypothetical protein GOP47_0030834 [Adiantum capillus-veneris]|nr:hypothetical protein GOP47_0030834 [Adiantum capillus-veneris]
MNRLVYNSDRNEVSSNVSFMDGPGIENLIDSGFWSSSPSCQINLMNLNNAQAEEGQPNMESSALHARPSVYS